MDERVEIQLNWLTEAIKRVNEEALSLANMIPGGKDLLADLIEAVAVLDLTAEVAKKALGKMEPLPAPAAELAPIPLPGPAPAAPEEPAAEKKEPRHVVKEGLPYRLYSRYPPEFFPWAYEHGWPRPAPKGSTLDLERRKMLSGLYKQYQAEIALNTTLLKEGNEVKEDRPAES